MRKVQQGLAGLIVGGLVIILLADTIRRLMVYVIVLAILILIFRLLFSDRFGGR